MRFMNYIFTEFSSRNVILPLPTVISGNDFYDHARRYGKPLETILLIYK